MASRLAPHQIIQDSYDEAAQRIRVDAQVTANISGAQEVIITHTEDSIKIGDGTDLMSVNADGSINVNATVADATNEIELLEYQEANSVPTASETTVLTYTVPVANTVHLHRVLVSGTNIAQYNLKINGSTKARRHTWWTKFSEQFDLLTVQNKGFKLIAGDTVSITVLHNSVSTGDFNATLVALKVT